MTTVRPKSAFRRPLRGILLAVYFWHRRCLMDPRTPEADSGRDRDGVEIAGRPNCWRSAYAAGFGKFRHGVSDVLSVAHRCVHGAGYGVAVGLRDRLARRSAGTEQGSIASGVILGRCEFERRKPPPARKRRRVRRGPVNRPSRGDGSADSRGRPVHPDRRLNSAPSPLSRDWATYTATSGRFLVATEEPA